ncbi:MAG: SAM-dependent DNA methyltransferase [Candidatus Magasanikbacteria bacterium]|nr:SAM-dependent DNA methyltransferase [Candidatus Magasanikbacteria bacterium]
MPEKRSENSYINNDVIPFLNDNFGYPIHNAECVKINDVPIFGARGNRAGSIDIVYYHNGNPVLLVEAKTKHKSHAVALEQALFYLKNFPLDKEEFAPSGLPPKILATTVGKDIKFYKWKIEVDEKKQVPEYKTEEITILPFEELLRYYGLSEEYQARVLEPQNFKVDFFDELLVIFKYYKKEEKITKDIVKEVVYQIHNYLLNPIQYTTSYPYTELNTQGKKAVYDLFKRFDLVASLGPDTAIEFRKAILRSFQGEEFNQYLTEKCVIDFVFGLIGKLNKHTKVLDFECGSGGFLATAINQNNLDLENVMGVDIEDLPYIIAKTYFALYFKKTGEELNLVPIRKDNGLFYHGKNWDLVVGNPAGSSKYEHGDEDKIFENLNDDLNKDGRQDRISEYNLSIQQAIQSARIGGKICLVLPEGVFSNSQDEFLRKYIAKHCNILAIVSLPPGSFKRGTAVSQLKRGAQSASMKMSIMYAEKTREVKKNEGLEIDLRHLNYPIFLAHIDKVDSKSGEISEWLEERLNVVLEQWKEWQNKAELNDIEKITTKFDKGEKMKESQKTLFSKVEPERIKIEKNKKTKPKEGKSETKISKNLEDLLN